MSAIHYKFSSSNDFKNVTFNGLSISVQDCKRAIMEKEKLKFTEVDLRLTNAQNLKDYTEEGDLIPKNSSLLVRRVPVGGSRNTDKAKVYIVKKKQTAADNKPGEGYGYLTLDQLRKTNDLAAAKGSEQDKIKAMIDQSTTEYDPSKYYKPPRSGSYQRHDPHNSHSFIKCYKCNQPGHYSVNCRLNKQVERAKSIRPATGIPRSHMVQVNKDAKGAMLTPDGHYVVPFIDKRGYEVGKKEKPPFLPDVDDGKDDEEEEPVPDELICLLCKEIMEDAVVIPCCGNSYCDECIRNALLESDEHECPTCHKKSISPDSLIANKFLRQAVNKFRNETGISRKKRNAPVWPRPAAVEPKPPQPTPKPTKVTYAPPKCSSLTPVTTTGGDYVVKAKSAQLYAAAGYTIKKATQVTPVKTEADSVTKETETPTDSISSGTSTADSDNKSTISCDIHPPGDSPESSSAAVRCLSLEGNSDEETKIRKLPLRKYGCIQSEETATTSDDALPKINPLNMMVERPEAESKSPPPPPPPPLPSDSSKQGDTDSQDSSVAAFVTEIDNLEKEEIVDDKSPSPQPTAIYSPPSLLGDTLDIIHHQPVQSQTISITLKNAPPIQAKAKASESVQPPIQTTVSQSAYALVDPPMHVLMPAQKQLNAHTTVSPAMLPPRMGIPPPSLPIPLSQGHMRIPPPSIMQAGVRPPNIPTSIPPPNFLPPTGPAMGMPPPLGALPPGMLPPHLPFPPPPGLPPPGYLGQPLPGQSFDASANNAPPPPGTGTPPIIVSHRRDDRRERNERSLSRSKRDGNRARSPARSKKSKLAMMSDEFTREQKQRAMARRKKHRRHSKSRSSSGSSSSYSSSSRSSSNSSYSSSGSSSSYSSSQSSRSRSASPRRRKKRVKRGRKSQSRSSRSVSSSPHKRRVRKTTRRRKAVVPSGSRRRRSRSVDENSPRRKRHHRSRSRSRERKRTTQKSGVIIPGMPPQSVLDYERDVALYEYYKQKYEQDWLRSRISPPSPFKRFINYNPTAVPPPGSQPPQVERDTHPAHVIPIQTHANPLFSQPPPPGDATPTEEDAGLYAFGVPTPPGNYFVQPGPAPWDPTPFDGDLAKRARLQEESYYNQMQNHLHGDHAWGRDRYPEPRDRRGHYDRRSRDRHDGDRRRRGLSPVRDRGRSWERDADRYHSRQRRSQNEMTRNRRSSREYDSRSKRRDEKQRESRSSRQESSRTRKRTREQSDDTSSRHNLRRSRRERDTKKSTTPERRISDEREPYPPGEGDGTPVRDESRVEFMNERIKVKVVNEKAKAKEEKRSHKSSESRPKERPRKNQTSHAMQYKTERRVVKSHGASPRIEETNPAPERSPTPTLDEEADNAIPTSQLSPQESKIAKTQQAAVSHEKRGEQDDQEIASKPSRSADGKKIVRKTKVKVKQTAKENPKKRMHSAENSKSVTSKSVAMPKSKWDSDEEAQRKKSHIGNDEADKKSEKSLASVPIKSRKIRIKKPAAISLNSPTAKTSDLSKNTEQKPEVIEKKLSPPVSDSRRVVVSSETKSTDEPPPLPTSKSPRALRQSASHIDEASFEPDYNDNESEKPLSNYAPSDIDEGDLGEKVDNELVASPKESEKSSKRRKDEEIEVDGKDHVTDESEESHDKSKRKKKKRRKHKKHKHVQETDEYDDADSASEENGRRSSVLKSTKRKSAKHSDDWDSEKHKKDHKRYEKQRKTHKRKQEYGGQKRKSDQHDYDDDYSDEDELPSRKRSHSHRSPKEKKRKVAERDQDALSLDEDMYSLDEYRSPSPDDKRKHKKKQKHKKTRRESKDVRSVASRIRLPK